MSVVVTADGLDQLIGALRADGRTVVGPVVRDSVITHAEIDGIDDLPQGWTEDQEGGRYRLEPTGTDERFAFSSPSTSWKRFLYPERTLLVRSTRRDGHLTIDEPTPDATPLAFFGIRSCDVAALGVLDRVLLAPDATDPTYAARRADTFVVAVACNHPGNTCFCVSMDTGPTPSTGTDLTVRELAGPRYLIEAGTDRGAAMLDRLAGEPAIDLDEREAVAAHEQAVAAMGRRLDPDDPPRAALAPDHPRWEHVAERCLTCANCTMVCPTCFCSTTTDSTSLTGDTAERWRLWDSCFTLDFSYLHGGAVRSTTKQRYRQWLLHKLVTWHDQFDTSGCVGCGRCITWCPVGIDLTEEVAALASGTDPGGIP